MKVLVCGIIILCVIILFSEKIFCSILIFLVFKVFLLFVNIYLILLCVIFLLVLLKVIGVILFNKLVEVESNYIKGFIIFFRKIIMGVEIIVRWFFKFIVICLGYNFFRIIEIYVKKISVIIFFVVWVVVEFFSYFEIICFSEVDKLVFCKRLIKVILIWIVDKKLLGFLRMFKRCWYFLFFFLVFCFILEWFSDIKVILDVEKKVLNRVNINKIINCSNKFWLLGFFMENYF